MYELLLFSMEIVFGTAICGCFICPGNLFSLDVDVLSNQNDFLLIGQFDWLFSFDKGEFGIPDLEFGYFKTTVLEIRDCFSFL